jgi:phage-related protein
MKGQPLEEYSIMYTVYTVEFYETEDGDKPVFDFMISLEPKMRAKVGAMMQLLAEKRNELRKPYTEHLDDGILKLRTIHGNNISRTLFFFYVGDRIIITNSFIKKNAENPA